MIQNRHFVHRIFSKEVTLLFFYCFFTISCSKPEDGFPDIVHKHITIIYLEANNDLRTEAYKAINDLEKGLAGNKFSKESILVYIKDNNETAYLLKIQPDDDPHVIKSDTLKSFIASEKTDGKQVHTVLSYIKEQFYSEVYNLIFWSHGTAWTPADKKSSAPTVMSIGEDRGKQIDILDFRDALPMYFNYIIFDACAMASIEVLYEFKNNANYIIASPTDILAEGFPYSDIVPYLSGASSENLIGIAQSYFEYYHAKPGAFQSATISVVELSKLEKVASYFKIMLSKHNSPLSMEDVQRLDFTSYFPIQLYDFGDFIGKNFSTSENNIISTLLDEAILYKCHTDTFLGNRIDFFSGLTLSYPQQNSPYYDYYANLSWPKESGWSQYLQ